MTGATAAGPPDSPAHPIAVVGLACRFPDADDPAALLDLVLTGRRAFRRIPRGRLDLADYYSPDPGAEDATYSTRAALIEGWRFDPAAFGVSGAARASADPARWLALETTARALAAAGFPGGAGLPGARAGAYLGGAMSGEGAPAAALRLRWPYSRRVISEALSAAGVPANVADRVLEAASARYLAPFPPVTAGTLAGSTPASVAAGICGQFGLRGGGVTVAAAGASSLAAVATACLALAAGEVDVAVTGGVDLSIDPLDLVGLAKAGVLAIGDMRVYDEHPTGFLPGEGCGVVLLMRAADARAANLPVYAEILGWGSASACGPGAAGPEPAEADPAVHKLTGADPAGHKLTGADPAGHKLAGAGQAGQLLAMRRAHEMARVDPADVQLIEGCGTGVPAGDLAELTALAELRAGARHVAALGSISANIGNTRAAAGAAGLIKAVLAIANGVLPPSTGVRTPHPMLRDGRAALRLPVAPEPWPAGVRHAGVSAVSQDGLAVHLVLRGEVGRPPASARTPQPRARSLPRAVETRPAARARSRRPGGLKGRTAPAAQNLTVPALRLPVTRSCGAYSAGPEHPCAYLLHATDQRAMVAVLTRIAAIAPWLSDAQLQDLAVQLARTAAATGPAGTAGPAAGVRIALTASGQDELAGLASEAARLLPGLTGPVLGTTPGIFADPGSGDAATPGPGGHVALVISGQPDDLPDLPQRQLSRILAVLRWLDELGVGASAAVGHGIGELAGLVWAGCMTPADARTLTALRSAALAAPGGSAPGQLGSTIGKFGTFTFRPPSRPLVSGSTGKQVTGPEAIAEVLCAELFAARLAAGEAHVITGTAGPATTAPPAGSGEDDGSPADGGPAGDQDPLAAAVAAVAEGARLMVLTGQDHQLANAVAGLGARGGPVGRARPAICIDGDPADDGSVARAAAALFAAGALARPEALYAGRPSRPFDIWREQVFLTHPCETPVREPASPAQGADQRASTPDAARPVPADAGGSPRAAAREARPAGPVAGVGPWVRCYVERTRPAALPVAAEDDQPWRLHTGGCEPLRLRAGELFRHDPAAGRTLALIGGLDDAAAREASVRAARDAIGTGRLVVIGPGPGPAGVWATLRAEHPSVGVTVVRAPLTAAGIGAARRVAVASPGEYRELTIGPDGAAAEPVLTALPGLGGGEFPLGPDDVVLLSRGSGAAGLVLAQVLACSGAAVAVIGRDHPDRDDAVVAGLEQLRGAGAKIGYELVDLADHAALAAAVRRVEAQFGCVTAISHAAGPGPCRALAELTPADAENQVRRHTDPLDQLAAAARTAARGGTERSGRLRLIITSGSVISRYGLAGEAIGALATGALADFAQQLAAGCPGCRALHVDWPAWSGAGLGEPADLAERMAGAGFTPLPVAEGSRQLLKLLATDELPARVAVHGRVGGPAPRPVAAAVPAAVPGSGSGSDSGSGSGQEGDPASTRFVERVLVHYPGVELVAEASLSLLADPYLGDYQVDGVPVLAPTMALEAMAQAASVLAGVPLRRADRVSMSAPIVLPAGAPGSRTVIRLCALREGSAVTVLVRSDNSGFGVEHCRAVFSPTGQDPACPRPSAGSRAAADPGEQAAEAVYGTELYGSVYFQAGRFRRLATVRLAGSRAAIGLADGADELPWFGAAGQAGGAVGQAGGAAGQAGDAVAQRLVLGSAGLSDATLQLVQACVPHRRLMPEGCDHVVFDGREPDGMVTIRAVRQSPAPPVQAEPVPRPRAAPGENAEAAPRWDVSATDAAGRSLIAWKGLRMRDAGPLSQPPAPLPRRAARQEPAAEAAGAGAATRPGGA